MVTTICTLRASAIGLWGDSSRTRATNRVLSIDLRFPTCGGNICCICSTICILSSYLAKFCSFGVKLEWNFSIHYIFSNPCLRITRITWVDQLSWNSWEFHRSAKCSLSGLICQSLCRKVIFYRMLLSGLERLFLWVWYWVWWNQDQITPEVSHWIDITSLYLWWWWRIWCLWPKRR